MWVRALIVAFAIRPPPDPKPKYATFDELYLKLFRKTFDPDSNIISNFSNPYKLTPSFSKFPHSNLTPELFGEVLDIMMPMIPRLVVEVGSLFGHSAILMGSMLDQAGLGEVPVLCIDPWTGDLNMWNNRDDPMVDGWTQVADGRMLAFDQFMVNVQFATSRTLKLRHLLPFHATSTIGARWLKAEGLTPDIIFLDSAHEQDETLMEILMYYQLLAPGGILLGDDYGWPGVKHDVDQFVATYRDAWEFQYDLLGEGSGNAYWRIRKPRF
jgi:hypothetical protein